MPVILPPPLVTETDEPVPWTDCTWASGLMGACAVRSTIPATRAEREALRTAGLPLSHPPGANLTELARGLGNRYGMILGRPDVVDATGLRALLGTPKGRYAVVQGHYSALPASIRASSKDPGFDGDHAAGVCLTARGLWWEDPLAPHGYPGQPISDAALNAYAGTLSRHWLVGLFASEGPTQVVISPPGVDIYDASGHPSLGHISSATYHVGVKHKVNGLWQYPIVEHPGWYVRPTRYTKFS